MLVIRDQQMREMAEASPGTTNVCPCPGDETWIEVRLVDDHQAPLGGAKYRLILADSSVIAGKLDDDGRVRIDGIVKGMCQIAFPELRLRELSPP